MSRRSHACVDCGTKVPPQDDESALISIKYGWRLTRIVAPSGEALLVWRCPDCWTKFRAERKTTETRRDDGT